MPVDAVFPHVLGRFLSIFKAKDPLKREIVRSITLVDKMLRSLEVSKKNLESVIDEHRKRLKAHGDDGEISKIVDDEIRNTHGYLSMITKTIYDLTRVKYRLETLFYVEEPIKLLPEILDELRAVEPLVEKINPQLINQIRAVEQRVANIMIMSSTYMPGTTTSTQLRQVNTTRGTQISESVKPTVEKTQSTTPLPHTSTREPRVEKKKVIEEHGAEATQIPTTTSRENTERKTNIVVNSNIPIHVVEQWILMELRVSNGILDLGLFERKYGVSRDIVLEALRSLEARNVIRVRRK